MRSPTLYCMCPRTVCTYLRGAHDVLLCVSSYYCTTARYTTRHNFVHAYAMSISLWVCLGRANLVRVPCQYVYDVSMCAFLVGWVGVCGCTI